MRLQLKIFMVMAFDIVVVFYPNSTKRPKVLTHKFKKL